MIGFGAMFLAGLLFAFFLVNGMKDFFIQRAGILSDYYFRQLKYREFDGRKLLPYFLGKRMKWAALLLGGSFLRITFPAMLSFAAWMGFSFGLLVGIGVLKFGGTGLLIGLLLILPQGVCYLAGAFVLFQALIGWESAGNYWPSFPAKRVFLGVLLLFLGILTESYVNPWCLRMIFRLV